jgi:hypothetical protein
MIGCLEYLSSQVRSTLCVINALAISQTNGIQRGHKPKHLSKLKDDQKKLNIFNAQNEIEFTQNYFSQKFTKTISLYYFNGIKIK